MFRGQYDHTLDTKGRVSLPARFREVLSEESLDPADRVILTRTFQKCLVVYPFQQWTEFEERIRNLPQFDPAVQRLKRVYIAGAVECSLDKHGRILVPSTMRQYADLLRDVVWVGQLETIELWSQTRWQSAMDEALEDPKGLSQAMADLGL